MPVFPQPTGGLLLVTTAPPNDSPGPDQVPRIAVLAALLLAGVLRLLALRGDLGLDEIWSWLIVQMSPHPLAILLLRHDNNHLLNTLIMWLTGTGAPDWAYRLPAVIASIVTVWLAGRVAGKTGGTTATVMAWLLVGGSYLLILYGSEARGYAYAVCFAFVAWDRLWSRDDPPTLLSAVIFAASCVLGFLAHLTFLYAYAGFCLWTLCSWRSRTVRWWMAAHLCPGLTAIFLYLFYIGGLLIPKMAIGGGNETTLFEVLISTLSLLVGGPQFGDGALAAGGLAMLLTACALASLRDNCLPDAPHGKKMWPATSNANRNRTACLAVIILLAPAGVLLTTGHGVLYPRYFVIPAAFALLTLSEWFARWWRAGGVSRGIVAVLVTAYLIGNGWWTVRLFDHGRGDYSAALRWMAGQSHAMPQGTDSVTVGSDHDFRNKLLVDYLLPRLGPTAGPLRYVSQPEIPPAGTDWFIRHNFEGDAPFPDSLIGPAGKTYRLERVFTHHSLTGWNWWVYRRAEDG